MGGAPDDKYRLHALRKVREQEETERKRGLAEAVSATAAAREEVARRLEDVERAQRALRDAVHSASERAAAGDASVNDMVGARQWRSKLEQDIGRARADAEQAEHDAQLCQAREDEARAALADAARERKAVEVHYERWQADRAKARARKQEEQADDIAQSLHRRGDKT